MELSERIRERVLSNVDKLRGPVEVFLSSGVDSTSVLLACLEAGKDVVARTFMLDHRLSTDARIARRNAKRLGVPCEVTILDADPESMLSDVRALVRDYGLRSKSDIECAWPMLHAIEESRRDVLVMGHGSDGVFGLGRKMTIAHCKETDPENMDASRDAYYAKPNRYERLTLREIAAKHGKAIQDPFEEGWREMFRGLTWRDVNKPRQKEPLRRAFVDRHPGIEVRPHQNYQLGDTGIAKAFRCLLPLRPGAKSTVAVYNAIARGDI